MGYVRQSRHPDSCFVQRTSCTVQNMPSNDGISSIDVVSRSRCNREKWHKIGPWRRSIFEKTCCIAALSDFPAVTPSPFHIDMVEVHISIDMVEDVTWLNWKNASKTIGRLDVHSETSSPDQGNYVSENRHGPCSAKRSVGRSVLRLQSQCWWYNKYVLKFPSFFFDYEPNKCPFDKRNCLFSWTLNPLNKNDSYFLSLFKKKKKNIHSFPSFKSDSC